MCELTDRDESWSASSDTKLAVIDPTPGAIGARCRRAPYIDRKALPAPELSRGGRPREFVAPRTALEGRLTAIWEELTEYRPIGVADDFFEIGGNSLLEARMFAAIRKDLGTTLPFETILSAPTIERLAEILAGALGEGPRPLAIALKVRGSRPPFFAIPGSLGHSLSFGSRDQIGGRLPSR